MCQQYDFNVNTNSLSVYTVAGAMIDTNSTFKWQQTDVQQHSAVFTPSTPAK
jgi:hypothetical protein